jgi:hypothetical protein
MQAEVLIANLRCRISARTRKKYLSVGPDELYVQTLTNNVNRPTRYNRVDVRFTPVQDNGDVTYIMWHTLVYKRKVRPPLSYFIPLLTM